ncbi:MAG: hypothetical protein J6T28_10975 [Paludibacteraceae bacterium]|nr:hypothetical protein [Paludibacteraceae bacterium]MBP5481299.1 hypothetical protein [Paludibacteraceae bacterium]
MKKILLSVILGAVSLSAFPEEGEFMKVAGDKILVDGSKRCYQIRKGHARRDMTEWTPYCGEFSNFYYVEGYQYTMFVEKYDPQADTIRVIKTVARDNSEEYFRLQKLREKQKAHKKNNN